MVINNAINNKIGGSNSGQTNTLTVDNASNTASSQAQINVTVGGTSSGDPYTTYTVSGATNWSEGIDNSASDAFVIAASTALGTTNVMSMAVAGAVSVVLGNLDVTKSASGADVSVTASNTSNTASSNATQYATVAGTSAGDAQTQYAVSGTTTWTQGIDNSVTGDPFVLAASTALGTTNVMSAATTGEINYPLQPSFLAYKTAQTDNVTGDGTAYVYICDGEVYDQGGDYDTSTGIFTAPVTGRYIFYTSNGNIGLLSGHTQGVTQIVTSNRTYNVNLYNVFAMSAGTGTITPISVLADLDAADTSKPQTAVSNGTKVVDIQGATDMRTHFSGSLIC